jgi:signal transduction histidine kinase
VAIDGVIGLLLAVWSVVALDDQPISRAQHYWLFFGVLIALGVRSRAPLAAAFAALVTTVGIVLSGVPIVDCSALLPAIELIAYSCGALGPGRPSNIGLAAALAAMTVETCQDPVLGPPSIILFCPLVAMVWGYGRFVAILRTRSAELERRNRELMAQRAKNSQLAVELERDRVSSDLEPLVAHGVQSMLEALACAPTPEESLARVEVQGRELLAGMRRLLASLRSSHDEPQRMPQPSLDDVERLFVAARSRGISASWRQEGDARPLSPRPERSAYRIIERVLDTTPGAPVDVCVRWREQELEIDIETGVGADWPAVVAAARERAALCGGRLDAARPASSDRASMRARFPLTGARA